MVTTEVSGNAITITCKPGWTGPQWLAALRAAGVNGREVRDFTFEILPDGTEVFSVELQPQLTLVK